MKKWKILHTGNRNLLNQDIIKILLSNRGFNDEKDTEEFLSPDIGKVYLKSCGIDKKEFEKFKKRIGIAIEKNEKIIIYGDYDVDGICATAVLWETLFAKTKNVFPFIPDRINEGYGLSEKGIDKILTSHPDTKIIVTVDNGIVAFKAVEYARKKGIEVIVSDHHVKTEEVPNASCILHTTSLCGAGIAWVLAKELAFETKEKINEKLELACLATVADLVPLIGNNRAIVKMGLEELKNTKRIGLRQLFKVAGVDKTTIGVYTIGHILGPRINATGRIESGINALRLLCTKDIAKAKNLAEMLDSLNKKRQDMTLTAVEHAKLLFLEKRKQERVIVVSDESYNPGVIGLIASAMVENFYLPSFAINKGLEISKGSARSIKGVNIIELLRSVSHTLIEAGGHPMAAGFSVETSKIEEFYEAISKEAESVVTDDILQKFINVDLVLPFENITNELYINLKKLAPYGMGNPEPVFATKKVSILQVRKLGKDGSHLKLTVEKDGKRFDAIGFGMAEESQIQEGDTINIAYQISENEWNGRKSLQLKLKDIKRN